MSREDALALYREQVALVWSDGVMGRQERILLDQMRDNLHLKLDDTARMEREAAKEAALGPLSPNGRTRRKPGTVVPK